MPVTHSIEARLLRALICRLDRLIRCCEEQRPASPLPNGNGQTGQLIGPNATQASGGNYRITRFLPAAGTTQRIVDRNGRRSQLWFCSVGSVDHRLTPIILDFTFNIGPPLLFTDNLLRLKKWEDGAIVTEEWFVTWVTGSDIFVVEILD